MKTSSFIPKLLKLVFVVLLCGLILAHKANKPRILVIHSYLNDYDWVREINEGMRRVFDKQQDVTLRYHYMDLKNHLDENFRTTASKITHRTIRKWRPDVIILSDDWAQKLIGTQYLDDPDISIVFCGVNANPGSYGYDKANNVTGILERKPLKATKETLLMIAVAKGFKPDDPNAEKPKVVFIGDKSLSVEAAVDRYSKYDWSPLQWVEPYRAGTWDEWKAAVERANNEVDLVLVSDIRQVRLKPGEETLAKPKDIMEWTEKNSKNPVLCMAGILVMEDGGMMSVAASGYEQGGIAAARSLEIARGKSPKDMPIVETEQFLISVRKSTMDKRNLPIPSIYEAFARATDNFAK